MVKARYGYKTDDIVDFFWPTATGELPFQLRLTARGLAHQGNLARTQARIQDWPPGRRPEGGQRLSRGKDAASQPVRQMKPEWSGPRSGRFSAPCRGSRGTSETSPWPFTRNAYEEYPRINRERNRPLNQIGKTKNPPSPPINGTAQAAINTTDCP